MFQKAMIFCVLFTSICHAQDNLDHEQSSAWSGKALSLISSAASSVSSLITNVASATAALSSPPEYTEFTDQERRARMIQFVENDSPPYMTPISIKGTVLDQQIPLYRISYQNPKDVIGKTFDITRGSTTYRFEILEFLMKHNHPYLTEPLGIAGILSAVYFFPIWSGVIFCGYVGGSFYIQQGNKPSLLSTAAATISREQTPPEPTEMSGSALLYILGFGKTLSEVMSNKKNPLQYNPTFDPSGRFVYEADLNDGSCIGKQVSFRTVLQLKGTVG